MSKPPEPCGRSPTFGISVMTRTLLALGACRRKVMVRSVVLTSGEGAAGTTLASTPAPPRRPPGVPGGLLLIWAWTETATSAAMDVAVKVPRIRFIGSALDIRQPRGRVAESFQRLRA